MDYPKSVPNVGLVNGKFVDENTTTGQVGSLIPASWGNSVTTEILNVLKAASITPDELSNDQLYKAISKITAESGITKDDLNQKADKATTLGGYGITDGATKTDIGNLLPRTGGTLSGRLTLTNGTDDSPELSLKTPGCTANLDLIGSTLRVYAERGGETVFPLQLDIAAKVAYLFNNAVWHGGNFNPGLYLQAAQLPRNTSGAGWWRCGDTGMMIQWGTLAVTTGGAANPYGALLFSMSFAAGALQVLGTAGSNLAAQGVDGSGRGVPVIAFDALTNSGARWRMDSNNGAGISNGAPIRWIAIGF